jgi:transcriptional regulator with XRE-family HTH domain
MNGPEQATQEREKLSALLRRLRADASLSSRAAANRAGFSQSKLSKVENGLLLPSEADLRALCRTYQVSVLQRQQALTLLRRLQNEHDSARVILRRGAYRMQQQIGRIESETRLFRDFQPAYVLGLVQTPAYMRRVLAALPADDREQAVDARLARQRVLNDSDKQFHLVMTEGALRWRAGSRDVMVEQLDHILAVAHLSNVALGVIPWRAEVPVFPGHAFHAYDDRLVIVGTLSATATIRDPRDVALYAEMFGQLAALASYGVDAETEIRRIRKDYQNLS